MSGKPRSHNEAVQMIQVAELAEDVHAEGFLGLDELAVEQLDQDVTLARVQRVLPELDDRVPSTAPARAAPARAWRPLRPMRIRLKLWAQDVQTAKQHDNSGACGDGQSRGGY
jgi:hypothetical protein